MLRSGPQAAADQAKEYASEARGAWKALTGENYGSDKAEDWEPAEVQVSGISQADVDAAAEQVRVLDQDLAEAQQTLGGHKANAAAAAQRQQRIQALYDLVEQTERRSAKLKEDEKHRDEWDGKLVAAREAAEGEKPRTALECPCCNEKLDLSGGVLVKHNAPQKLADPEAAKRVVEYNGYLESALRAVQNSQRDLQECITAADQLVALEQEAAAAPGADAIANAEQTINELRQDRDKLSAKHLALQEAMAATSGRTELIAKAAKHHVEVQCWSLIADALGPNSIPAEILADAIGPMNSLLDVQSAGAGWSKVQISSDIDITFGGRLYGLLSESEKWRCDTMLAIAIARLSGIGMVVLDRLDVLDLPSRGQALSLLRGLTADGVLKSVILAGTLKQPMATVPAGMQAVWIDQGVIHGNQAKAA